MATFTNANARTRIEVAEATEIARLARGADGNVISTQDMQQLLGSSALVLDGLRRRPRYFDGRFLTGADLTRDQDYIRQRQADLARAGGTGVVLGLEVTHSGEARGETLIIEAGHGVTPGGELVAVATRRTIPLLDLANSRRLDATFGLRLEPRAPLGRRTGLFILALRPVEFTANPIAAYPTTVSGPRQVEDGDIIEATAITLVPYPDTSGAATLEEARRAVARDLFLGDAEGLPQDALPIAMIALERGSIRWVDTAMVRRETGADTPLQVSMGARPRAVAEAFVLQHRRHLADVLRDRRNLPATFAAAQYFAALPAAGQLPAAAILTDDLGFRQLWFPPSVDVDVSFVPSDEIGAVVEESLTLPPIDLTGRGSDLGATGVVVLAPVSRARLQRFEQALSRLTTRVTTDLAQGFRRPTADVLLGMLARRAKFSETATRDAEAQARSAAADAETKAWQAAWAEAVAALPTDDGLPPRLWYVRRRAVAHEANVVGVAVAVSGDDLRLKIDLDQRVSDLGVTTRVRSIVGAATTFGAARISAFLGSPKISNSDALFLTAVARLEKIVPDAATPAPPEPTTSPPVLPPGRLPPVSISPTTAAGLTATRAGLTGGRLESAGLSRLAASRTLINSRLAADAGAKQLITEGDVIDVASDFADPRLGEGLDLLGKALGAPALTKAELTFLADTENILDLDRTVRDLDTPDLPNFAATLRTAIGAKDTAAIDALIAGEA